MSQGLTSISFNKLEEVYFFKHCHEKKFEEILWISEDYNFHLPPQDESPVKYLVSQKKIVSPYNSYLG